MLLLKPTHLLVDPFEMLHVMSELVREHVRLRKLAGRAELVPELVVEAEIDVEFLVERTVERTHRRLGLSAPRLHAVAKEHELRVVVAGAFLRQDLRPRLLRVVEHERHELHFLVFGRRLGAWRRRGISRRRRGRGAATVAE